MLLGRPGHDPLSYHRAMENTLHLMNGRNETYRKSLTRVDKSSKDSLQHAAPPTTPTFILPSPLISMSLLHQYVFLLFYFPSRSCSPPPAPGEEVGQLEMLEGQWRAALDKLKHKKKLVHQLEEDLQV